jgi:beta-1,4-mannosyl-glycoprotein beta-1,4-N-acetylglucosaminyltransferase
MNFCKERIFDCVTYFKEDLQLELRFNILDRYVDKFIICEGSEDHQGRRKKINFKLNRFSKFKNKIIHVVCDKFPKNFITWERQAFQREYIFGAIKEAGENDFIIFSDPDEIPNPEKLINLNLNKKYGIFLQKTFCYKFNLFNKYETPWSGSRVAKKKDLKSFNWLRQSILLKNLRYPWFRFDKEKSIQAIYNGGWHFNNLMSPKDISLKLKTFAHTEYASKNFSDIKIIKKKIRNSEDLFNKNLKYEKIIFGNTFPKYIIRNKNKYYKWIL